MISVKLRVIIMHPFVQILFALCCVSFLKFNSDVVQQAIVIAALLGIILVLIGGVIFLIYETITKLPKWLRYARIQRQWERKFGGHDYK